jgi:hypothetical protein
MNRISLAAAAAACSLLVADLAVAAEPAPPSAAAKEVAQLLVTKENWSTAMQQLAESVQQNLQRHPGSKLEYPKDMPAKARAEVEAALPYDDLIGMHAKQLSASYSDAELREVSTFFRTPTGKKWLETSPKVSGAVAMETQQRFAQKMPEIMKKLSAEAKGPEAASKPAESTKKPAEAAKKAPAAPKKASEPAKKPAQ